MSKTNNLNWRSLKKTFKKSMREFPASETRNEIRAKYKKAGKTFRKMSNWF